MSESKNGVFSKIFWPDVSTAKTARIAVLYGFWSAILVGVTSCLVAIYSLVTGHKALGMVSTLSFVDGSIFLILAYGIFKNHRSSAVIALMLYVLEKISQILFMGQVHGLLIMVILFLYFASSARGTFALNKFNKNKDQISSSI